MLRVDGFSERPENPMHIPNELFSGEGAREVDLNDVFGSKNRKYKPRGLLKIFDSYKFTIEENTFLRLFGKNTTWYLQSHFLWFRLSILSIQFFSFRLLWRLTIGSFCDGHPYLRKRQTSTVTPAKPGDYLLDLGAIALSSQARSYQKESFQRLSYKRQLPKTLKPSSKYLRPIYPRKLFKKCPALHPWQVFHPHHARQQTTGPAIDQHRHTATQAFVNYPGLQTPASTQPSQDERAAANPLL